MAAYAIASVKQKIDHLLYSQTTFPNHLPIPDILKFYHKVFTDLELVIAWHRRKKFIAIDLAQQIEDVVDKIEDLIGSNFSSPYELLKVNQEITCLEEKLGNGDYKIEVDPPPLCFWTDIDDELLFGRYDSIMGGRPDPVGLDKEIQYLKYIVMRGSTKLKITLVYGMAGCGKTTLVEQVYPELVCNFDVHVMVTIAIHLTLGQILAQLLTTLGFQVKDEAIEMVDELELGKSLMNLLKGRRYLCVLDNLWDFSTWNQLKVFFPDDCNKSRIICTSRDMSIFRTIPEYHCKAMMNDDDSWKLLCDVIFRTDRCNNSQLEEMGREIAKKCEGLPLAIISMGKLLRESEITIERWEKVLENDDPFEIKRHDCHPMSKSLFVSYDMLPYYLKLCFLYMGVLPQNYAIDPSQLIVLWIAEGLITPRELQRIEDTGQLYFDELCFKNMVMYEKTIVQIHKVHMVFRSLCIKEAQRENFCLTIRKYDQIFSQGKNLLRRLCIHNNTLFGFKEVHDSLDSLTCVSSILYCGPQHKYPLRVFLNFKDLKILQAVSIRFYEFPLEILELFRLRYLAITYDGKLPRSISKLWKLEFLILGRCNIIKSSHDPLYLPVEIWNLQWLKHINCVGSDLLDPRCPGDVLKYLIQLSGVSPRSCTPKILARMRNLRKLTVHLDLIDNEVECFDFFNHVAQNLKCLDLFECIVHRVFDAHVFPSIPTFPTNISALSLSGCGFPWKYMGVISVLPKLRVLQLTEYAFCGPVWEVGQERFPRLLTLIMKDLNLEEWRAKSEQFPNLLKLEIYHCYNLQEIPIEFGDIPKLKQIFLYSNNVSVEKSARQIQQRRQLFEDVKFELEISTLGSTNAPHRAMPDDNFFYSTILDPLPTKT